MCEILIVEPQTLKSFLQSCIEFRDMIDAGICPTQNLDVDDVDVAFSVVSVFLECVLKRNEE